MKFCLCRRCLEDNRCKVTQLNRSRKSVCSCVRLLPLVHTVIKPGGQRIAWMLTVKECFPSLRIHFVLLVCLFVKLPVRLSICEPVCSSVCLPRFVPLPVGHVYDPSGHFFFFNSVHICLILIFCNLIAHTQSSCLSCSLCCLSS